MPRVTCSFCGLPFSVRAVSESANYYCCSGCALASRIPVNDGKLPVSRGLVVALVFGFGIFNELLFAVFAGAVAGEGSVLVAARLALVSLVVGALAIVSCMVFLATATPRRWTDAMAVAPSCVAAGLAAWRGWQTGPMSAVWLLTVANIWLAAWLSRGWARRAVARKKS